MKMTHLRCFKVEHVWEHAGIDWRAANLSFPSEQQAIWILATPVRDAGTKVTDSKFFKSVASECDSDEKKASLMVMLYQLRYAMCHADYQSHLKTTNVQVKEAHKFTYRNSKHKIWELKYQKKDRIYFFTHLQEGKDGRKFLIPVLFHHKRDQATPASISSQCETAMKPFLNPQSKVELIKEKS